MDLENGDFQVVYLSDDGAQEDVDMKNDRKHGRVNIDVVADGNVNNDNKNTTANNNDNDVNNASNNASDNKNNNDIQIAVVRAPPDDTNTSHVLDLTMDHRHDTNPHSQHAYVPNSKHQSQSWHWWPLLLFFAVLLAVGGIGVFIGMVRTSSFIE
ncbi:hypothetical protein RFI_14316 [Reticulomyxa filosa]|uniref:Uncharacterized protein n=1 Tax=Reticulomyxa filosa TaxID=46433 RepID=X6NA58_RETFI|nr:hypothetical protein RFI_14316 [Reticulomyxa filosa]|eukprot:ETO22876.1 hypothetical protein RFI_14316 [Reticulomyxa filosa]